MKINFKNWFENGSEKVEKLKYYGLLQWTRELLIWRGDKYTLKWNSQNFFEVRGGKKSEKNLNILATLETFL